MWPLIGGNVADIEHIKRLTEGTAAWNAWRAANPSAIPDLRYVTLGPRQKQFSPINGGPVNLRGALLFKADLSEATLIEADLRDAELIEANLRNAQLNHADLCRANLMDAVLSGADLAYAKFAGANLAGADLADAINLTQAQVDEASGDPTTHLPAAVRMPDAWMTRRDDGPGGDEPMAGPGKTEDPYAVLGVEKGASGEAIQAIYRGKAKSLHPDLNPGNAEAAREFQRFTRAYTLLRDPARRARYDRGEIDADGEETEAYADAINRAAQMRRTLRVVAITLAAAAVSAALAYGAWLWWSEDDTPPPPPPAKVKVQGRM